MFVLWIIAIIAALTLLSFFGAASCFTILSALTLLATETKLQNGVQKFQKLHNKSVSFKNKKNI